MHSQEVLFVIALVLNKSEILGFLESVGNLESLENFCSNTSGVIPLNFAASSRIFLPSCSFPLTNNHLGDSGINLQIKISNILLFKHEILNLPYIP